MLKVNKTPILLTLTTLVFIGCSSKDMHTTGTTIDKILPRYGLLTSVSKTIITNPLKANEEEKMRKIAEAKQLQKEREYKAWFNSLSKEEQQKVIANRQEIAAQSRRSTAKILEFMFKSAANSSPTTLDQRDDPRIYRPYSR